MKFWHPYSELGVIVYSGSLYYFILPFPALASATNTDLFPTSCRHTGANMAESQVEASYDHITAR